MKRRTISSGLLLLLILSPLACTVASEPATFQAQLQQTPFKIAYETYADNNWEIFVMNADGSNPVNLTHTPNLHEHYPQISPDGTKIAFAVDEGEGRDAVRTIYYMDIDGKNRKKVADHAREQFWSPDGKTIGFLKQEYPKFNVMDYYTTGIEYFDLAKGTITAHPNSDQIHHLYNPTFAQNGKWIVATVHAGMGFGHAILAIEAYGDKIVNLGISGCRPCLSPDGKQIAWGPGDHELAVSPIDFDADPPKVGPRRVRIFDSKNKIYHVDWSPDSRFLSFSRGPNGEGDLTKPGTFQAACEIVGVYAKDWNLYAVSAEHDHVYNFATDTNGEIAVLTTNGLSNKESAWFRSNPASKAAQ